MSNDGNSKLGRNDSREFRFYEAGDFHKDWTSLGYGKEHFEELKEYLCLYPEAGSVISGTGGARKMRWRLPDSGGTRIIYFWRSHRREIFFLMIYAKIRQDNLTPAQKRVIRGIISRFKK